MWRGEGGNCRVLLRRGAGIEHYFDDIPRVPRFQILNLHASVVILKVNHVPPWRYVSWNLDKWHAHSNAKGHFIRVTTRMGHEHVQIVSLGRWIWEGALAALDSTSRDNVLKHGGDVVSRSRRAHSSSLNMCIKMRLPAPSGPGDVIKYLFYYVRGYGSPPILNVRYNDTFVAQLLLGDADLPSFTTSMKLWPADQGRGQLEEEGLSVQAWCADLATHA